MVQGGSDQDLQRESIQIKEVENKSLEALIITRTKGNEHITKHIWCPDHIKDKESLLYQISDHVLDWNSKMKFEAIGESLTPLLLELVKKNQNGQPSTYVVHNHAYIIPNGSELPPTPNVTTLDPKHAPEIVQSSWFAKSEAEEMVRRAFAAGRVLGVMEEGEMVSWAVVRQFGVLSLLYTKESHRGRGFGLSVMSACSNLQRSLGLTSYSYVVVGNEASRKLHEDKGGYVRLHQVWWIKYEPMNK